jgi:hypothetical protein
MTQLDQCATQNPLPCLETLSTSFAFLPRVHPVTTDISTDLWEHATLLMVMSLAQHYRLSPWILRYLRQC